MRLFYIPDGHRRYAAGHSCTLAEAYAAGIKVLEEEIIRPILCNTSIADLDVFCLSNVNIGRREPEELRSFLHQGESLLRPLMERCREFANVATIGTYLSNNIVFNEKRSKSVRLFIGTSIEDVDGINEVDIFVRSGGELRLSGAPRRLIGDYTEFYSIDKLHPVVKFSDFEAILDRYSSRYIRSTDRQ